MSKYDAKEDKDLVPFNLKNDHLVYQCSVLKVHEKLAASHCKQEELQVFTLKCANWVNIVPVTADGNIILVEQFRFGTETFTKEVPGGSIDHDEKDATLAAKRELEEETGYTSSRILSLSSAYPNPALQNNRVFYFIALNAVPLTQPVNHKDPFEDIKIHMVPVAEALIMARTGQINHVLSAYALLLAQPYLEGFLKK